MNPERPQLTAAVGGTSQTRSSATYWKKGKEKKAAQE